MSQKPSLAVIGSGISGLFSAYFLSQHYQVTLFEQNNYYGGHSNTLQINYNGLNGRKLNELTDNGKINPFDNKVVIIDEAHNFVSRVVNKIKKPESLSYRLYDYLMSAQNVKIVFLTGTPIINYPNEIAILFNMLRGYIKTWTFQIKQTTTQKVDRDAILNFFENFQY
jgi:monoamine oxidase